MEKIVIHHSGYHINRAIIESVVTLTDKEKLFSIRLPDGAYLDHEPGQFVEVSLFGVGEAPISVCSSPSRRDTFELCVRAAGRLTTAMHRLEAGAEIGIRGPFGTPFPLSQMEGNHLFIVAGGLGIAPLRSLINYAIDNRRDFGKVDILLGCKDPRSMLFGHEVEDWDRRADINFACTIDRADPDWMGNVGLITSLIPGVDIDPLHTVVAVAGPPIMYRYVVQELLKKHIPENRIYLTLERHMKCGLGKCGHCQIHDIYCCQDGPVFTYERIKTVRGAI